MAAPHALFTSPRVRGEVARRHEVEAGGRGGVSACLRILIRPLTRLARLRAPRFGALATLSPQAGRGNYFGSTSNRAIQFAKFGCAGG